MRDVDLRTNVPVILDVELRLGVQSDSVTVRASDTTPLVDTTLTGTRTAVSLALIEQMPTVTGSRGLESVIVSFPGFAQNANGAIHPRGAHNQMTFVIDGLPISDQLTGAFANALDTAMVQNVELMTGNIPAEFGAKIAHNGWDITAVHGALAVVLLVEVEDADAAHRRSECLGIPERRIASRGHLWGIV